MTIPKKRKNIYISNFKLVLSKKDREFILAKTGEILKSNRWTSGPIGCQFEESFKKYIKSPYAVSVSDGGSAIIVILQALNIPEDSVVICPTLTAPPTPHAILKAGMRVVFADSSINNLGLNIKDVERKIKKYKDKVKAVITVHVGGWISPDIVKLNRLCNKHNIILIEDCAHAHGSFLNNRHAGYFGKAASYSFFMTKSLTCGEGGMVTSKDKKLIEKIKIIRNYGKNEQGKHIIDGFNYKFSEFNAAVALWASTFARRIIDDRRKIAANYDHLLKNIDGISVFNFHECKCGYYKYIITLKKGLNRDRFKKVLLRKHGIEAAGGVYDVLCHQEPYFKSLQNKILNVNESFPFAEEFSKRQVCLPLYSGLKIEEQEYIATSIRLLLEKAYSKEK